MTQHLSVVILVFTLSMFARGQSATADLQRHLSNGDLETREQTIITFNLGDLDPDSVGAHVQPPLWDKTRKDIEVIAETTNERQRISCSSSEKMKDGTDFCGFDISEFRLSFTFESFDSDYAKRFAKALRHAVELCEGKSSPL